MRIKQILNNNAVVVMDGDEETIAIGGGVGYNKHKKDMVNTAKIEKLFVLKENKKLQELLMRIPEKHFLISEDIIDYAEKYLGTKLNEHVLIGLTDHISFALDREKQGIRIKNKLLPEIKVLYKKEFHIGLWAIDHIKNKLQVEMPPDEAAFIALHIHSMKLQDGNLHELVRQTSILKEMIETIDQTLGINVESNDIAYERLIYHLRFALDRGKGEQYHVMDADMLKMITSKFPVAYQCAKKVADVLAAKHDIHLPEDEQIGRAHV